MAYQVEVYTVLKDNKIIAVYHTSDGIEGIHASIHNQGLDHDNIIKVPNDFVGYKGQHIEEFDSNHRLKSLQERVTLGHVELPENHKIENDNFVPMTIEEKVKAGKMEIHNTTKAVGNDIIQKTEEELITEGIKTRLEIDNEKQIIADEILIQAELRKIAIERLGDKVKQVKS